MRNSTGQLVPILVLLFCVFACLRQGQVSLYSCDLELAMPLYNCGLKLAMLTRLS